MKVNKRYRALDEHVTAQQTRDEALSAFFARLETDQIERGRLSLPAPDKTSTPSTPRKPSRVNFDYLKVWVYGSHDSPAVLCGDFERMQQAAKESKEDESLFVLGDRCGSMRPGGFGKAAYSMPFAMVIGGADLAFADLRKEWKGKGERPGMLVEFKGQYCYGRTPFDLAEEVFQWAKAFGFENIRTEVSRVDICIDRPNHKVVEPELRRIKGEVITRATTDTSWREHGKITGLRYGGMGSACKLTVYDKKAELRKRVDKASCFYAAYPEAKEFEDLTRYEFSLKRENLTKRHSIDSLEQLLDVLPDLIRYLCTDWYREIDLSTASRASRCLTAPEWLEVIEDCRMQLGGNRPGPKRAPAPSTTPLADALFDQAVGCLISRATLIGTKVEGLLELLGSAFVESPGRDLDIKAQQDRRRAELAARRANFDGQISKRIDDLDKMSQVSKAAAKVYENWLALDYVPF